MDTPTSTQTAPDAPALHLFTPPGAPPPRSGLERLVRELERHRTRALQHLARRGFADLAEDALQETLLHFVRKAGDPGFVLPEVPKAWLFRWSVCCAYVLRRAGQRLDTVSFDQAVEAYASACNVTTADTTSTPDAGLHAMADAGEFDAWAAQVAEARAALLPQDREALDVEVAREARGESANPRHRKRLERARRRGTTVFVRFGISRARPPTKPD